MSLQTPFIRIKQDSYPGGGCAMDWMHGQMTIKSAPANSRLRAASVRISAAFSHSPLL